MGRTDPPYELVCPTRRVIQRHRESPPVEEAAVPPSSPLFSIVMPVYNPEECWLRAAVASVRNQTHPSWELCIADDASTEPGVRAFLEECPATDPRIKVRRLPHRQGISGASNAALEMARGLFVAFLDHDDELAPQALFEVARLLSEQPDLDLVYSDEDKIEPDGRHSEPFFKPEFSPDLLMSMNYIGHLTVVRRSLLEETGGFRPGFEGSQDYDLLLRLVERTRRIAHLPRILYHWRKSRGSVAADPAAKVYAYEAAVRALEETLARRGQPGKVETTGPGRYRVRYLVDGHPLVSIVILTRNQGQLLSRCLSTLERKTDYRRYEVIVVDNGSTDPNTLGLLEDYSRRPRCRVLRLDQPFNYSRLNNLAAAEAKGDYLLFLNDDVEVVSPGWLEEMLGHARRPEVGAVGAKLIYPNGKMQHGGVVLGLGGLAGHAFYLLSADSPGYMGLAQVVRNCSAVTGACLMTRRSLFEALGGFDEGLSVAFNDVDFCLRLGEKGYYIVWTPFAVLIHHEGASRGRFTPKEDLDRFRARWSRRLERGDPFAPSACATPWP